MSGFTQGGLVQRHDELLPMLAKVHGIEQDGLKIRSTKISEGRGRFTESMWRHDVIASETGASLGALVEKVLRATEGPGNPSWFTWFREALLYADTDFTQEMAGIATPECLSIVKEPGRLAILMKYVEGRHPKSLEDRVRLAKALADFGIWSIQTQTSERHWLKGTTTRVRPGFSPASVKAGIQRLPLEQYEYEKTVKGLLGLLDEQAKMERYLASSPVAVIHGDAHPKNYLISGSGSVYAIDWARISQGYLGQDLAVACRPSFAFFSDLLDFDEYRLIVDSMLNAYVSEVRSAISPEVADRAHTAFLWRLMMQLLDFLATYNPSTLRTATYSGRIESDLRIQSLVQCVSWATHTVDDLRARLR